jgi:hypothetical protein
MWGFNFGYPPEADAATAYRWQGAVSCDGLVMEGSNPGGSYPRDVFLSGVGGIDVAVDVKPGTCPNPINADSRGVLVAAILGSADLDVRQIDPASVRLGAAAPLRSAYRDVATPYDGPHTGSARDCTTAGPDGFRDLVLHFDIQALGDLDVPDRSVVRLQLSGTLKDTTTAIEGSDVVVVHNKDCRKRH